MATARMQRSRVTPPPAPSVARSPKRRRVDASTDAQPQHNENLSENACANAEKTAIKDDTTESELPPQESDVKGAGVACGECGRTFVFASELVAHGRETQHRPFVCGIEKCAKSYSKQEHLTRHVETVHKRSNTQTLEDRKPFKCELCQARFTYKHGLTRHVKRSHKNLNTPFECSECLVAFKKKSDLQAHSYVHTGVLPFECEYCGLRFLKRFLLTRHERSHAGRGSENQVFVCHCSEMFFSHEEFERHKQAEHAKAEEDTEENTEEVEEVEEVGEGFGAVDAVDAVDAVTNDEEIEVKAKIGGVGVDVKQEGASSKLQCRVCDKTFQRKQYLRAHLRTHFESLDERKQFVCPMPRCDKAYTRASNLMAHYNAVHDERKSKRFACPREGCAARFGYKSVLKNHIEKVHDHPVPKKRRERTSAGILARALGQADGGISVLSTFSSAASSTTAAPIQADEEEDIAAAATGAEQVGSTFVDDKAQS